MPTKDRFSHPHEIALFWYERSVCAMRAASDRKDSGPSRTKGDMGVLSSQGAWSQDAEQITGLAMPRPCWDRIQKNVKAIALCCDLRVNARKRYLDPIEIVYIQFARKEKE